MARPYFQWYETLWSVLIFAVIIDDVCVLLEWWRNKRAGIAVSYQSEYVRKIKSQQYSAHCHTKQAIST